MGAGQGYNKHLKKF